MWHNHLCTKNYPLPNQDFTYDIRWKKVFSYFRQYDYKECRDYIWKEHSISKTWKSIFTFFWKKYKITDYLCYQPSLYLKHKLFNLTNSQEAFFIKLHNLLCNVPENTFILSLWVSIRNLDIWDMKKGGNFNNFEFYWNKPKLLKIENNKAYFWFIWFEIKKDKCKNWQPFFERENNYSSLWIKEEYKTSWKLKLYCFEQPIYWHILDANSNYKLSEIKYNITYEQTYEQKDVKNFFKDAILISSIDLNIDNVNNLEEYSAMFSQIYVSSIPKMYWTKTNNSYIRNYEWLLIDYTRDWWNHLSLCFLDENNQLQKLDIFNHLPIEEINNFNAKYNTFNSLSWYWDFSPIYIDKKLNRFIWGLYHHIGAYALWEKDNLINQKDIKKVSSVWYLDISAQSCKQIYKASEAFSDTYLSYLFNLKTTLLNKIKHISILKDLPILSLHINIANEFYQEWKTQTHFINFDPKNQLTTSYWIHLNPFWQFILSNNESVISNINNIPKYTIEKKELHYISYEDVIINNNFKYKINWCFTPSSYQTWIFQSYDTYVKTPLIYFVKYKKWINKEDNEKQIKEDACYTITSFGKIWIYYKNIILNT